MDDIPARVLKEFSTQLAAPLTHIINTSIIRGEWPDSWKLEVSTPIPKEFPPNDVSQLRNISGLKICDKITEELLSELIVSDMKENLDPSQYANQPGVSIEHYLIKLIHRILSETDSSSKGETKAILATLVDWKQAFPKQCPKLGIESFIKKWSQTIINPSSNKLFPEKGISSKMEQCDLCKKEFNRRRASRTHVWCVGVPISVK